MPKTTLANVINWVCSYQSSTSRIQQNKNLKPNHKRFCHLRKLYLKVAYELLVDVIIGIAQINMLVPVGYRRLPVMS